MKQKLTLLMVATLLLGAVFSINSVAWSFKKLTPIRIPEDQIVAPFFSEQEETPTYCVIQNDDGTIAFYFGDIDSGAAFAVYMDPAKCLTQPTYPFKITDAHFHLHPAVPADYTWPVNIQVNIREVTQGDSCMGPDISTSLCSESFAFPIDSSWDSLGRPINFSLSQPCCVNQPFFLEIKYLDPPEQGKKHPSPLMEDLVAPEDTCNSWLMSGGQYYEWVSYFGVLEPGLPIIRATGYTQDAECENFLWYWKPDTTHAPSGMPDFDQNQDEWLAYCGPTAVANCLWWFDAVPPEMTPPELIELLAEYFHTNPEWGTYVDTMEMGLAQYFIDYGFDLYEHTYYQPDFYEMEDSLKRSQDIILLLGFYLWNGEFYERIGGHFVTMAGVCSESLKVALSDPARDMAVWYQWPGRIRPPEHPPPEYPPTLHNDPTYVSQDMYTSTLESPTPGNPYWGLDYPYEIFRTETPPFLGQNFQPEQEHLRGTYIPGVEVFTEVEYAVMICPGEWYWKPDTTNAPSGMPDFDQNQDEWESYCGPTAVANCLWWFDAVPEGMSPPELIELLAEYFHTNPDWGTYVDTMEMGLDQYFEDFGFDLQEYTFWEPDFYEMEDSLKRCQDIILLLGFWYYDGQEWIRAGGHFVTMAGVHSEGAKVAFSDPDNDAAVKGSRPGKVRPPEHPPYPQYPPTWHNDPTNVSQDVYDCTINPEFPSPGSDKWEIDHYLEMIRDNYSGKNVPQRFETYSRPVPKDAPSVVWHTEVEAAVMICPKPSNAVEGEERGGLTPKDFELYQNYPNPFNNETVIKFNLRKSAEVTLAIYNVLGQKVRTLVKGRMDAGSQSVSWDGKDEKGNELSSGIYFYQLKAGEVKETKRLVLLK